MNAFISFDLFMLYIPGLGCTKHKLKLIYIKSTIKVNSELFLLHKRQLTLIDY